MLRMLRISVILGLVLSLLVLTVPIPAAGQGAEDFAWEHILVKFKAGTKDTTKQEIHRRHGGVVFDDIAPLGVQLVKIPAGNAWEKANAYRSEKAVDFAELDFVAQAIGIPDDPGFGKQWGLTKIQAPEAWDIVPGRPDIRIAILDTGVDQDHADLASKIVANKNFTTSVTVDDLFGHGTHVAGIAAAATNNGTGVAGAGYQSTIINGKVLGDNGSGYYSWVASGIVWAADNGAKVISMSLGGSTPSSTLENAINYAWSKGVVLVAAAGNSNTSNALYPAYYDNCIAVAASGQSDAKAYFSSYGSWVDVAAPGEGIYSTLPNHIYQLGTSPDYGSLSGTSMATPHVAGVAGLVWATSYGTDNSTVRSRIESTADAIAGTGTYWQHGRINAYAAVAPQAPWLPTLSVSVSTPGLTNQTTFTIRTGVTNSGDTVATAVTAAITLPPALSTKESLLKSLGDIAAKTAATVSWVVNDSADGEFTVTVDATAANLPPNEGTGTVKVDTAPPAQVTGLKIVTVSSSQLNLSWNPNTDSDLGHYQVCRGAVSGGPYTLIASPAGNSYQDTGLIAGTTYYYVVSAVDAAGNKGIASSETLGTTNQAVVNKIHVQSIVINLKIAGINTGALAIVTIVDASGRPLSGASVRGHWSGAANDTDAGLTDSGGQVALQSNYVKRAPSGATFAFTVDNVVLSGWIYDSAANVKTTGSIAVP